MPVLCGEALEYHGSLTSTGPAGWFPQVKVDIAPMYEYTLRQGISKLKMRMDPFNLESSDMIAEPSRHGECVVKGTLEFSSREFPSAVKLWDQSWKTAKQKEDMNRRIETEVQALQALQSDHIPNFYGVEHLSHPRTGTAFTAVIMEYVGNENLEQRRAREAFPYEDIQDITKQLIETYSYLHKNGVMHRDVKPTNIMLSDDGLRVKLIDFAFGKCFDSSTSSSMMVGHTEVVTCNTHGCWAAPEMLDASQLSAGHNKQSDIFSLGCVVYFLHTGKSPFQDEDETRKAGKDSDFRRSKLAEMKNPEFEDLVERMTRPDGSREKLNRARTHSSLWTTAESMRFMNRAWDDMKEVRKKRDAQTLQDRYGDATKAILVERGGWGDLGEPWKVQLDNYDVLDKYSGPAFFRMARNLTAHPGPYKIEQLQKRFNERLTERCPELRLRWWIVATSEEFDLFRFDGSAVSMEGIV
jgi:serine/threonine protein kinase